ncbi:MAG: hypothetical protein E5Y63_26775 [Mesorhizobium sp.]|nr:hypothetical protein EOC93_15560 [Mesorhizobium sp. M6A.T.Ce.TU.002.03.1.1]RWI11604.1 MAG: hypothetical protein EOQ90_06900 [Mesorhizobium sp.]RWM85275.1 MAG: hypothetical protein EOR83_13065 [Mesorhizobium sp.]RWM93470.1 MAG: hypothetical protein EOR84_17915 [Mesorhizobium sp.]TIM26924.1 MAG: hypothetical protein E5Y63_26775 [Mesorhizobium sp.]
MEALTRSLETGQPIPFETRLRRLDGVYRWFQFRGNPARDREGRARAIAAVFGRRRIGILRMGGIEG